jgi:ATP adenylyltransferase
MEHLWSPWRLAYVTRTPSTDPCVFCASANEGSQSDLVVGRGKTAYLILNLFPYNNGHLLIVPNRHVGSLAALSADELTEMMALTRDAEVALSEAYRPQGINVGINLGHSAGAGIVDHVHIHLVPRWTGDTNFMSVIGETRVLPEEMKQTASRLRPIFARLIGDRQP